MFRRICGKNVLGQSGARRSAAPARRRSLLFRVRVRLPMMNVECCVEVMRAAARNTRTTKLVDFRIERSKRIEVDAIGEQRAVSGLDADLDASWAHIEQDVAIARSQRSERTARLGCAGRIGRQRSGRDRAAAAEAEEHDGKSGGRFHRPIIAPTQYPVRFSPPDRSSKPPNGHAVEVIATGPRRPG